MKNKFLCLVFLLGLSFQAQAIVISFVPSNSNVGLGTSSSVDLVISGLGDDILTGFDVSVLYDDTLLAFDGFEFGTDCGGFSCLDIWGLGSLQIVDDWGFGEIEVFELSFDSDADLMAFQPDDFVLGTFTFSGLEFGVSALDILVWELAGEYVFDPDLGFEVPLALDADVQSGTIEVPEPGTLVLFMSGLLAFGARRKIRAIST